MKAFLVIAVIVCSVSFYFLEMEIHELRNEQDALKKSLKLCEQDWQMQLDHIEKYEKVFETLERSRPEIGEVLDLLLNGIDPWQNKKNNQQNSKSGEKTTPASKPGNGTLKETNTAPYR